MEKAENSNLILLYWETDALLLQTLFLWTSDTVVPYRSTLPLLSSMKFFFRWEERRRERRERASKLVNPEYQIMYVRQLFAGKKIYQCFDTKIDSNRDSSKNRIPSRYVHIITSSDLIGYKIATHYLIFSKEHSRTKVRFYFLLINLKTLFLLHHDSSFKIHSSYHWYASLHQEQRWEGNRMSKRQRVSTEI